MTKLTSTWSFNPSVGNVTALLAAGNAYYNAHTTAYPNGEIRGQFAAPPKQRGGGGQVLLDQIYTIPIDLLKTSVDVRAVCDYVFPLKLTCDVSLPKVVDPSGKALMVSINSDMLWDLIKDGYNVIKPLLEPMINDIAAALGLPAPGK